MILTKMGESTATIERTESLSPSALLENGIQNRLNEVNYEPTPVVNSTSGQQEGVKRAMLLGVDVLTDPQNPTRIWKLFEVYYPNEGPIKYTISPAINTEGETLSWTNDQPPEHIDQDTVAFLQGMIANGRIEDPSNKERVDRLYNPPQ